MHGSDRMLRHALIANALFSLSCGVGMLVAGPTLAHWIGLASVWPLWVVGPGLVLFAADLLDQARRTPIQRGRAIATTVADALWVVGSAVLLLGFPGVLNDTGHLAVVVVAVVVADCALWQGLGLRRLAQRPAV